MATCTICIKQYVGQTLNKFSSYWNAHCSIWKSFESKGYVKSFDATADNDKPALLKHFYKYHDLTKKHPFLEAKALKLNVIFVEQPKASYLKECEDKWFHKINAEINIKKDFAHTKYLCFWSLPFSLICDFSLCIVTLAFSYPIATRMYFLPDS